MLIFEVPGDLDENFQCGAPSASPSVSPIPFPKAQICDENGDWRNNSSQHILQIRKDLV
jgi:hypothetical protein